MYLSEEELSNKIKKLENEINKSDDKNEEIRTGIIFMSYFLSIDFL